MGAPLEVTVLVVHWNRPKELAETWWALKERLRYSNLTHLYPENLVGPEKAAELSQPNLRWAIADDHSPDDVFEFIKAELQPDIIFRTRRRSGLGINTNNALRRLTSDFVFQVDDDCVLKHEIDLRPGVDILCRYPEFGMVRYGGIAAHDLTCRLRELGGPPYPVWDTAQPAYNVWEILKKESHFLYAYSGGPHLKHRRFHEAYGGYVEGYKLGATEDEFAHRFLDMDGPGIICFPEFVQCYWDHIGQSRQLTEDDIGRGYA